MSRRQATYWDRAGTYALKVTARYSDGHLWKCLVESAWVAGFKAGQRKRRKKTT